MANQIIKGRDLMLFNNDGQSYAYATNHTLTITAETADISSKDHGIWGGSEVTRYTWEITSENLYTSDAYDEMFDTMLTGEPVTVRFGLKAENDNSKSVADGDYEFWTSGSSYYEGNVVITSLVANANNGENATFSVTLTGSGSIKKTTPSSVTAPVISGTTPFADTTSMTISGPQGASIYYTTDGSTPTSASTAYSAAVTISSTTTVKAIAIVGGVSSAVTTKIFTKSE